MLTRDRVWAALAIVAAIAGLVLVLGTSGDDDSSPAGSQVGTSQVAPPPADDD
ncbi:hypothetical protein WIS52_11640 [Pseudonocardia nematodicida]|uniref:Uncharacterized protein n=1 Tax=Pseudonocardia nematodicida TaxID=1206997 RepID=A0ABV1K9G6_9PSEU